MIIPSVYIFYPLLTLVVSLVIFIALLKSTKPHSNIYYRYMCICSIFWSLFSIIPFYFDNLELKTNIYVFIIACVSFYSVSTFLFVNYQIKNYHFNRKPLLLIMIIPCLTLVFAIFNSELNLIYSSASYQLVDGQYYLEYTRGFWFNIHLYYSYTLSLLSILTLLKTYYYIPKHFKPPVIIMMLGYLLTLVVNFILVVLNVKTQFDYTLIVASFFLLFLFLIRKYSTATNYILTSKSYIFNNLSSTIIVLDKYGKVVANNKEESTNDNQFFNFTYNSYFEDVFSTLIEDNYVNIINENERIISLQDNGVELHFKIVKNNITSMNELIGYFVEITDITSAYELLHFLELTANYDQLTGIPNRNAYNSKLIKYSTSAYMPLGIIFSDVNFLKRVNDTKGHIAGDALLKTVADILCLKCPTKSFVARLGGDEFVILVPNTNENECTSLIEDINLCCAGYSNNDFGTPSVAFGFSIMYNYGDNVKEYEDKADMEMYRNKKSRKTDIRVGE